MDKKEQTAKKAVLKGVISYMGKLNAEKFKPKPAPKEEKKSDDTEITPEMLEKLKALYAEKKEESAGGENKED